MFNEFILAAVQTSACSQLVLLLYPPHTLLPSPRCPESGIHTGQVAQVCDHVRLQGFREPGSSSTPFAFAWVQLYSWSSLPPCLLGIKLDLVPCLLFPAVHQGRGHSSWSQLISWPRTVPDALKKKKKILQTHPEPHLCWVLAGKQCVALTELHLV